jgi:hypothetical protein
VKQAREKGHFGSEVELANKKSRAFISKGSADS